MKVYFGADHGGFKLKGDLINLLKETGIVVEDCGAFDYDQEDDYPEIAKRTIQKKLSDTNSIAVLICRSGQGMAMAANRFAEIRAALVWNAKLAKECREDNDANALVLPADFLSTEEAIECLKVFISTPFSNLERHSRRIEKI